MTPTPRKRTDGIRSHTDYSLPGRAITLTQWAPELLFEVKAHRLKLLRMKAGRNDTDKTRLNPEMEHLLAGLIATDAARATV